MADYCTTSELKTRLDITGSTYDTQLAEIVTAASRWIDQHCRVPVDGFKATAATKRYFTADNLDGKTLMLDAPLLSVTSLKNGDGSTIAAGSWWLRPRNNVGWYLELKSAYSWTFATDTEIELEGVWGMAATPPAPVKEACLVFAGWMFKRYQAALSDATVNMELGELTYSSAVPKQVNALLDPYQLRVGVL